MDSGSLTAEPQRVQAVFRPFYLQKQQEDLIVDFLTLWRYDDVYRPRNLAGEHRENIYESNQCISKMISR